MVARMGQAKLVEFPEKACLKQGAVGRAGEVDPGAPDPVDMGQRPSWASGKRTLRSISQGRY